MLHAPLASCTVGEVKVALISECVVGDSQVSTRDLQSSETPPVTQMCSNDVQIEGVSYGGKGMHQIIRMTHLGRRNVSARVFPCLQRLFTLHKTFILVLWPLIVVSSSVETLPWH